MYTKKRSITIQYLVKFYYTLPVKLANKISLTNTILYNMFITLLVHF